MFGLQIVAFWACLWMSGCTAAMHQYPERIEEPYTQVLKNKDPEYVTVMEKISAAATDREKKQLRNATIDSRLRVIDLQFAEFIETLAKENVQADFGVAAVQVGVGAAGSLVAETTSQILSAASGALSGTQQAFNKTALFSQSFPALLAQMIAGRKAVLVKIMEGRQLSIAKYPLPAALRDLEAYYFAGSLPGAVVSTSADAKLKNDEAQQKLDELKISTFSETDTAKTITRFIWPPDGNRSKPHSKENFQKVERWMKKVGLEEIAVQKLLDNPEMESHRQRAIKEIPICKE